MPSPPTGSRPSRAIGGLPDPHLRLGQRRHQPARPQRARTCSSGRSRTTPATPARSSSTPSPARTSTRSYEVAGDCCRAAAAGSTFNVFSAPVGYAGRAAPRRRNRSPGRARRCSSCSRAIPDSVLFSPYNVVAHTHRLGLHDALRLLVSPAHELDRSSASAGRSGSTAPTCTWDRERGLLRARHRLRRLPPLRRRQRRGHGAAAPPRRRDPTTFRAWLDYVDTYLAVWVHGLREGGQPRPRSGRRPDSLAWSAGRTRRAGRTPRERVE